MGRAIKLKEQRKIEKIERAEKRKKRKKSIIFSAIGLVIFGLLSFGVFKGSVFIKNKYFWKKENKKVEQAANKTGDHKYSKAPDMAIDINKKYIAKFETNQGNFEAELNAKETPKTVNNFVFLAKDHFYDGLTWHRIIKDFMIQGGDPDGTGAGGPGYKFDDEKFTADYTPGTLAMANSGANTNGSQFFVMTSDYSGGKLPKNYTIFGKVTSGMDIITKIASVKVSGSGSGEASKPDEKQTITKVTIEEK